jgi:CBS domain-containing protein
VAVATVTRTHLLGAGAVFAVPAVGLHFSTAVYVWCVVIGVATGALGAVLTALVYAAEDAFAKLPVHWMWWPAIGGLIIGLGGIAEPRALGVGYDVIRELLTGRAAMSLIVGIFIVKSLIWSLSLGSGTSGGVLAPMFMIGGAFGALVAPLLPHVAPGFWPLICLAGVIGGVMRAPFTAVVFSAELTGRWQAVLPLLIGAAGAYLFTALTLKRSVLTEKVARRGFHLTREYDVDPLAILFVREVMDTADVVVYDVRDRLADVLAEFLRHGTQLTAAAQRQRIYPVTGPGGELVGVVTRRDLLGASRNGSVADERTIGDVMSEHLATAYPDETLRDVAYRMAERGVTRMPVIARGPERQIVGIVTLPAMLAGRLRDLQEERDSERVLQIARPRMGPGSAFRSRNGTG